MCVRVCVYVRVCMYHSGPKIQGKTEIAAAVHPDPYFFLHTIANKMAAFQLSIASRKWCSINLKIYILS